MTTFISCVVAGLLAGATGIAVQTAARAAELPKDAEPATSVVNTAARQSSPFADKQDLEDAKRGFIASLPDDALIPGAGPRPVWTLKPYAFLGKDEPPATVNPSLWRQAQLNLANGLFKVTDRVYQVRGLDIANMTIIEGERGLIIIDTLLTAEAARAALDLYYKNRPNAPIVAVIYTHSHADHFGGTRALVDEEKVRSGEIKVIAPEGFTEHAISENVIAGSAMSRRAQYQFGQRLAPGERGQVDAGLGKTLSLGTVTLVLPNDVISKNLERRTIDGLDIVFQLTPGTEAPAEMNIYFPQLRLLNVAENVTHTLHNLYAIRGAEVRDGNAWAKYIDDALTLFGDKSDALIAQHHWPTWGQERIVSLLKTQRDTYKFVHDQSVRLLNQGYKPAEISESLKLPASLAKTWSSHGYYGTLSHNAKAVYQKYLGWYDANPANLNPLPPVEAARKTVEYGGGAAAVLDKARADFKRGEFRWVASIASQVVFADPSNQEARALAADAFEQLGYQAESAIWRNAYLFGASELRNGVAPLPTTVGASSAALVEALPLGSFFDLLGVRLNADRAEGEKLLINWTFTDLGKSYVLNLENSALTYREAPAAPGADAGLSLTRATLNKIVLKQTTVPAAVAAGEIKLEGNPAKLRTFFGLLDDFDPNFPIVEPRKAALQ